MSGIRAELTIHGRVQGVFYRQSTREKAHSLGLTGWVKNCPDGSVAAVFEGDREVVEAMIEWCRRGPVAARVSEVVVAWRAFRGEFSGFEVR